jgi:hypothetical protein
VTRLVVVLAILAAASVATIVVLLRNMSDPEGFGLPNVEPEDAGEYELWDRASGNRLGTSPYFGGVAIQRWELVRQGGNADDLVIGQLRRLA